MLTLKTARTHFPFSPSFSTNFTHHSSSSLPFEVTFKSGQCYFSFRLVSFKQVAGGGSFLGFRDLKRRCEKGWESEGYRALEAEILEFMKGSKNPEAFPSKKELVEAGRMDLVEGILREGGWLASGWELDEEEEDEKEEEEEVVVLGNSNGASFEGLRKGWGKGATGEGNEEQRFEGSVFGFDSSSYASSSGRSLERCTEDNTGIEGILTRLAKERQITFGVDLIEKGRCVRVEKSDFVHKRAAQASHDETVAGLKSNSGSTSLKADETIIMARQGEGQSSLHKDGFGNSHEPDTWRTWSIQRAAFYDMEFEADDITYDKLGTADMVNLPRHQSASLNVSEENSSQQGIGHNDIKSRLQHLELELSSVLQTLKSHAVEPISQKDQEGSSDALLKLSDDWEFQQNEIVNAQDKLRSIRAKLAVLEGKMALAMIDTQKLVEEKQKRINDARRALELLRMACIVWPNSASVILLAGSFDGWVSQRKMEKSRIGIFSLYLKLYPGRYEIKFIVDGVWKIDPLRPVVCNNGYENNLLIIT